MNLPTAASISPSPSILLPLREPGTKFVPCVFFSSGKVPVGWRVKDPGKEPCLFCHCAETFNQVSSRTGGNLSERLWGNEENEAQTQRGCDKGKRK